VTEFETAGKTVVIVLVDGAADTVADLTNLTGIAPVLLSGDNPRAATTLAAEVGIDDVRAGLLPQDKVTAVRNLENSGARVLLVGDGVNDAPALATAHTGIAMGRAGSDLALETAAAANWSSRLPWVPVRHGQWRVAVVASQVEHVSITVA
jgi:P-type E1-E2 ATPase